MEDLIIKGIKGINEAQDPELIGINEVTVLKNLVLNKSIGQPTKRGGYTLFNTNTYADLKSLHDVVDSGGNNYVLASASTAFIKSSVGTGSWSTIKTGLTTGLKTRLQSYNAYHYVTNGTDAPFVTDLTSAYSLSITAPDVSGVTTLSVPIHPNLTIDSIYQWILVFVANTGDYSTPSSPFTHYATNYYTTTDGYTGVQFSNLPVSSDPRVVRRLVFRTVANGNVFYLCASLDNTSTSWTDGIKDTELDQSQYIVYQNSFNSAKYIASHQERMFLAYANIADEKPKMVYGTVSSPSSTHGYSFYGSAGTGGSLSAGTYYYKIVYVDSLGKISTARNSISVTVGSTGKVTFYAVPLSLETGVQCRVYRSTDNVTFYFIPLTLFNGAYDDGITATSETLPSATTSTTTYKTGVFFSEIGKPSQFNSENAIQVFPDDGDEITGLLDDSDGVIIFKRNSICKIYTNGNPLNWQIHKLVTQIGCDEPLSVQKIGQKIYFMSNKQVYRYPDSLNNPVSLKKKNTFANLSYINDSCYSNKYQWYIIAGAGGLLIYDELMETWYEFVTTSAMTISSCLEKSIGSTRGTLLLGGVYLRKYNESSKVDNPAGTEDTEITTTLTTKTFTVNNPNYLVRPRIILANYVKRDDQKVTHTLSSPEDTGYFLTIDDTTNSTLTSDYKNFRQETDGMTGTFKSSNKLIYSIFGAGLDTLNGILLKYRIINRGRRDV